MNSFAKRNKFIYQPPKILGRLSECNVKNFSRIIFVGNGAIEGGDLALERWRFGELGGLQSWASQIESYTLLPWLAANMRGFRSLAGGVSSAYEKELQFFVEMKVRLAEQFKRASLFVRPSPYNTQLEESNTLVVSLNWDLCLRNNKKIKNLIELHGSCEFWDSIILPTETVFDYRLYKAVRAKILGDMEATHCDDIGHMHSFVIDALSHTQKIILWGVSLSIYDCEVMALLNAAKHHATSPKYIEVLNPDLNAAKRAAGLFNVSTFDWIDHFKPYTKKRLDYSLH